VNSGERVELLDILRGVAVLGILLVNMQLFFFPLYTMAMESQWTEPLDRTVEGLILFFAQGKFYTMFSFLFGLGMAVQMERADARGRPFAGFFARRLLWLLLFGWCHAFLVWYGDILGQYALVGFLLLLFARRKNTTLTVWTVVLLLLPIIFFAGITALIVVAGFFPEGAVAIDEAMAQSEQQTAQNLDEALRVYPTGGYGEILPLRAKQVGTIYTYVLFAAPNILAMFLIGLNLGRRRLFHDLPPHLPRIRKLLPWLLALGLILSGLFTALRFNIGQTRPSPLLWLQQVGFLLGSPALSFSYVFGIALLAQRENWLRRLQPIAAVGRMALSNYLMHSLVFTLVANGYGLGFYGRVRPPVGLAMTLAMFAVQIVLSNWWLRRFRFGPMEWLWRSLSYRQLQPMRR
jgi:uncharacterized protein